jgi:hypothetical protein
MISVVRPARREETLVRDPLGEFHVWWDDITTKDIVSFKRLLARARRESTVQKYLERHPIVLIQHFSGGHGRWVIPQKRLGSEHITDFLVGSSSSIGHEWLAVELESPSAPLFTKQGDPSKTLNHAIRQISDWRGWLKSNKDYASRDRDQDGLGLTDIDSDVPGLILIGRRRNLDDHTRSLRRELGTRLAIQIHTYDWLLDTAGNRVTDLWHPRQSRSKRRGS